MTITWKVTREVDATLCVCVTGEVGHDATVEDLRAALDALPEEDRPGLCENCECLHDLRVLRSAAQGMIDAHGGDEIDACYALRRLAAVLKDLDDDES